MDGFVPQASLFLGIIPALVILYFGLKGFEGKYKEKNIFLSFVVGIIVGFFAALARMIPEALPLVIVFVIVFAFIDQLIKTIILNIPRLQEKIATPIYGLALGLGFGSIFTLFLINSAGTIIENDMTFLIWILTGAIGMILFHAGTGALIGYGIFYGKLIYYLFIAIMLSIPLNIILDLTRFYENDYFLFFQITLLIYGLIVYIYVIKKLLPNIYETSRRRTRR